MGIKLGTRFEGKLDGHQIQLEVVEVWPFESLARILSGPDPTTGTLFFLKGQSGAQRLRYLIRVAFSEDQAWANSIEHLVEDKLGGDMELVLTQPDWILHLTRTEDINRFCLNMPSPQKTGTPCIWLTDGSGFPIVHIPIYHFQEFQAETLLFILSNLVYRDILLHLEGSVTGAEAEFEFTPLLLVPAPEGQGDLVCQSYANGKGEALKFVEPNLSEPFRPGVDFGYRILNKRDTRRYFYVLNFGPDGGVRLIFPNAWLNTSLALVPKGVMRSGCHEVYSFNQIGIEYIRVLVSDQPLYQQDLLVPSVLETRQVRAKTGVRGIDCWNTCLFRYQVGD